MTIRHMRIACWITNAKDTHTLTHLHPSQWLITSAAVPPTPQYLFVRRYLSMGTALCWRNRIFWYVALRQCTNGTGRFDRTTWLQLKGSRGPLKFLDGPLHQSCAPQRSRYSDWLWAGRSGDRTPVGVRFSAPVHTEPGGPPSLLYNGYRVFPGSKERLGSGADPSPPCNAVAKKE